MAGNQADSCEGLTTRQKIAVMQAFCNGKPIQVRASRVGLANGFNCLYWQNYTKQDEPDWDWWNYEYRIKEQA